MSSLIILCVAWKHFEACLSYDQFTEFSNWTWVQGLVGGCGICDGQKQHRVRLSWSFFLPEYSITFFFSSVISIMKTLCSITFTLVKASKPICDSMYQVAIQMPLEEGLRQTQRDTRHFMHIVIFLMGREWLVGTVSTSANVMQYDIPWINLFEGLQPFLLPGATFS